MQRTSRILCAAAAMAGLALGGAALAQNAPAPGAPAAGPPMMGMDPAVMADLMKRAAQIRAQSDWPGSGPFPADYEAVPSAHLVVFHPVDMAAATRGGKLKIYLYGNGGCQQDVVEGRVHLADIASHGYVAVAPGRIDTGPKAKPVDPAAAPLSKDQVKPADMIAALDWIIAENGRAGSPFYQKVDTSKVAVSGHSCGGLLSMATSLDPRVKAVMLEDSGILPPGGVPGAPSGLSFVNREAVDASPLPILYVIGGPTDIAYPNAERDFAEYKHKPIFLLNNPTAGHMGTFLMKGDAGNQVELDWMAWQLDGDKTAAKTFTGADCRLCVDPKWVVKRKGIN